MSFSHSIVASSRATQNTVFRGIHSVICKVPYAPWTMHSFATTAALLLGSMAGRALAATAVIPADVPFATPWVAVKVPADYVGDDDDDATNATEIAELRRRDIRGALPVRALAIEHKFQPVLDFDKDGCYYTSAIDPNGNRNPGLGPGQGVPPNCLRSTCRDPNRLQNSNVYSRARCNNGWCAIMYEYYFEKDQVVCGSFVGGHRHDWENIVVFVRDNQVKRVAPSCHAEYKKATNSPRLEGQSAKVVYHKDGARTHCFRWATAADDKIENYTGKWFQGKLVGWLGWPSVGLRDKAMKPYDGPNAKLPDGLFKEYLGRAAGDQVPGFKPDVDGPIPNWA
ncbi:hypothetical protein RB598_008954 [Gaeumannomyces tritici]